ncbi:acyl-coenzyme A diphosphatase NUDT19 [Amyelois transitella]|uniref:acyl-coenzyme A diphosphatase NUDT19 n=1 Tax=Amyelois transitella TaxID=680683 RepID=UPI00298F4196|nr:acyl-coenzyme A diphosphatase NUDT19 [Amyelois transitella]
MNSAIRKGWRNSASLIVLNKRVVDVQNSARGGVNYDVLLQTRPSTGSFPNSVVFPGGVSESADGGERWLQLYKSYGFGDEDFAAFHRVGTPTSALFQPNPIQRHIELRITAIRETFEELGLLICSRVQKVQKGELWASFVTGVDIKHWQDRIAKDPAEFFNLCEQSECYPDIWSLYYWSNWLSPKSFPKRFNTAFFVAALAKRPQIGSSNEVVKVEWSNPLELLERNSNKEVELYPPQQYELTRLARIRDIKQLAEFAQDRSGYCGDLIYPVSVTAKNGILWVNPGDQLYPSTVDYHTDEVNLTDKTLEELREESKIIHRLEKHKADPGKWVLVTKNLKQNNHIDMCEKSK